MKTFLLAFLLPLVAAAQDDMTLLQSSNLRRGLVGAWSLDETSGTRYDWSPYGNHLASSNSVGSTSGVIGNCATFASASSRYLTCDSNPSLQIGTNTSFEVTGWFYQNSLQSFASIFGKINASLEYQFFEQSASAHVSWLCRKYDDSGFARADFPFSSATTWTFFDVFYDNDGGQMGISLNGLPFVTTPMTGGVRVGSAKFQIGSREADSASYWDGRIDNVYFWKRTLSREERRQVRNLGAASVWPRYQPCAPLFVCDSDYAGSLVATNAGLMAPGTTLQTYATLRGYQKYFCTWFSADTLNYVAELPDGGQWSDPIPFSSSAGGDANHNYASMVIDRDGYIHSVYGAHGATLFYQRTTGTNSVSAWSAVSNIAQVCSYPSILCDQSNKLYVFYRGNVSPTTNYQSTLTMITSTNRGTNWSAERILVDSQADGVWWTYHGVPALGSEVPQQSLHITFNFRFYDVDHVYFTNVFYLRSNDGGTTWLDQTNGPVTLPITRSTAVPVVIADNVNPGQIWCDTNSVPFLLNVKDNGATYWTNSTILMTRPSSNAWTTFTVLTNSYENASMVIDSANTFTLWGLTPFDGHIQLMSTTSIDGGTNWSAFKQLTFGTNDQRQLLPTGTRNDRATAWFDDYGRIRFAKHR